MRDASNGGGWGRGEGGRGGGTQANSITIFVIIKTYMKSKWPPIRDGCLRADSIDRTMVQCTVNIILVPYNIKNCILQIITGD